MELLIKEYERNRKALRAYIRNKDAPKEEKRDLMGMSYNLEYSHQWLKKGYDPDFNFRKGIPRLGVYNRDSFDPLQIQKYFIQIGGDPYGLIHRHKVELLTSEEKERIDRALSTLLTEEKEVYLLVRGNAMTNNQVAKLLNVSVGNVKSALAGADRKLSMAINQARGSMDNNATKNE